jgi:hypothetical protein
MSHRCQRFVVGCLIALVMLTPGAAGADDRALAALYDAAKKEGQITIYGPGATTLTGLEKEFPKAYPGIQV